MAITVSIKVKALPDFPANGRAARFEGLILIAKQQCIDIVFILQVIYHIVNLNAINRAHAEFPSIGAQERLTINSLVMIFRGSELNLPLNLRSTHLAASYPMSRKGWRTVVRGGL